MTEFVPSRCVNCGRLAPSRSPICSACRHKLAHVCYGKIRHYKATALSVQERERRIPGRENTEAYGCPICGSWHTGRTSPGGARTFADASLICLRLMRFHDDFLAALALAWDPKSSDRMAWRKAVSPHRYAEMTKEASGADTDALPA
jgi:hypothetical protein